MIYDSINLLEGSEITNLTAPTGTAYPSNANEGELFFRTDSPNVGLYIHNGTTWLAAGSGGGSGTIPEITSATITTTSTTQTPADTFATSASKVVEYLIQVAEGTSYQAAKILVVTDGTIVNITEYGQVYTGSSLGDFAADISGGNVRLLFTAATTSSTVVKVVRTSII